MKCPRCHTYIANGSLIHEACGWGAAAMSAPHGRIMSVDGEQVSLQCSWNRDGMQCEYPGVHSDETKGKGPWYCQGHYQCFDPIEGMRVLTQSQHRVPVTPESIRVAVVGNAKEPGHGPTAHGAQKFAEIKAILRSSRRTPREHWQWVLDDPRAPEDSKRIAREVLHKAADEHPAMAHMADRVPGADDE